MTKLNIFIAGHRGMVGSELMRQLQQNPKVNLITASRDELDLASQAAVQAFFKRQSIDQVYLAAAKVGGIHPNKTYPADFIYENLMMEANIIHAAYTHGVQKLLFLGSSRICPRLADDRKRSAYRYLGANQRTLRHRQDCRHQAL